MLELDGYCERFNIAFEYDGEHHTEIDPYRVGRKLNGLLYQKFKDEQKKKNCVKQGITLINIQAISRENINNQEAFLEHVILNCNQQGLHLTLNEQQLKNIKEKF